MTIGTKIIERSLTHIGVNSPLKSVNPESVTQGMDTLNSMNAELQDEGIEMGLVPLKTPGQELSEPLGVRNALEFMLAVRLAPDFPAAVVSPFVQAQANIGYNNLKINWQVLTIPKKRARGTLPMGQGNRRRERNFFDEGEEIG